MPESNDYIRLRFQAVVIASQLPGNAAEALLVLDYARHMVGFLDDSSAASDNVQRVSGPYCAQIMDFNTRSS